MRLLKIYRITRKYIYEIKVICNYSICYIISCVVKCKAC